MFIFSESINTALKGLDNIIPLEPPYVQVTKGKHVVKQKLGSVLSKLYPGEETRIKALVEEYKEINGNLQGYRVEYSTEYVEVYSHTLYAIDSTTRSCMTNSDSVRIYGYDERLSLLLVYKDSKLVLRTLVRDDRKEYIRLYLDHNFIKAPIARAIVAREGYNVGSLEGIKLECIWSGNDIICPYLDGGYPLYFNVVDDKYLLVSSSGEWDGSDTNGYARNENYCVCEHCGTRVHIEDSYYAYDQSLCENCYDCSYISYNGESYHKDNCVLNNSTMELIPLDCVNCEDMSCTDDGEWYNSDEVVCVDEGCYHIDDCYELVQEDADGNSYAFTAIKNPEELDNLAKGYWTRDQIIDILDELDERLSSIQTDIFEAKEVELSREELDILTIEIVKIQDLLEK